MERIKRVMKLQGEAKGKDMNIFRSLEFVRYIAKLKNKYLL